MIRQRCFVIICLALLGAWSGLELEPELDPLLGKWYSSSEPGSSEYFEDGTAIIDDGTITLTATWSRLAADRVQLEMTILGATTVEVFIVEVAGDSAIFTSSEGEVLVMTRTDHRRAQRETIDRMRTIGAAWFSWLTDQLGAAAAGKSYNVAEMSELTPADLEALLVPDYLDELPEVDGWDRPFEFRSSGRLLTSQVMSIRSPGSDGRYEGSEYEMAGFPSAQHGRDIVWADGFFVRYPQ
jgi:hypothetical protein